MSEALGIALFTFLAPAVLGTVLIGPWSRALHAARENAGRPLSREKVRRRLLLVLWVSCALAGLWAYWLISSGLIE
jgi:hypothetical protein